MPVESPVFKKKRAGKIITLLRKHYPEARCALNFTNPLELLVATQLSAQCTDKRVNLVTKKLFHTCKTAEDYARIPLQKLETLIQSTGFFRNKARNIQKACQTLAECHRGQVPEDFDQLVNLAGVGRKTAHVVMGNAFNQPSGLVVDTHVRRLSNRMGLVKTPNVYQIERELEKLVPKKQWIIFSHWMIEHGRGICSARRPLCSSCFLSELCPRQGITPTKQKNNPSKKRK
ncbi:MAG: endonuclease III [Bdellovibrionales bacterium]|nr:endonuclease III [Bdellovibrionales bacterium]